MEAWRQRLDARWAEAGIEGLLSPCQYHAAFKTSDSVDLATVHDYYMIWNFVHFPAGVIPVTTVRNDEAQGTYIADTNNRWKDK